MNVLSSLKGRIEGIQYDYKSKYWEYIRYYYDDIVWDKTVLFEAFGGKNFQGNPYYLFKAALQMDEFKAFTFYIAHRNPTELELFLKNKGILDTRVEIVEYNSKRYREVLSHAKYLINNVSFTMDWIKKDGQIYLNTWHGTPLKCLGRCIKNEPFELNNSQRNMLLSDLLLAPNEFTEDVFDDDYMIHDIDPSKVILGGYPRNSVFFDCKDRENMRKKNGLTRKTAIFYMPTWRGTASGVQQVDFAGDMEQLAERLGNQYVIYVKLHPAMLGESVNLTKCKTMPEEYEVYEFLNAMDILITDYSSVYFDFANTKKRILFYQTDRETYFSGRGFYTEVLNETPYPIAETLDGLEKLISSDQIVDDSAFRQKYCKYDHRDADVGLLHDLLKVDSKKHTAPIDLYVINFPVTDEILLHWKAMLDGTNFRFVFVPRRSNMYFHNVKCFNIIDYLICFDTQRTLPWEVLKPEKMQAREKKRLWGDLNIKNIYSRDERLPVALRGKQTKWPDSLQ